MPIYKFQVEVLRGGDNRLVKYLFRDENKLAVTANPSVPVPKARVTLQTQKSLSGSNSSTSKNKKTVISKHLVPVYTLFNHAGI